MLTLYVAEQDTSLMLTLYVAVKYRCKFGKVVGIQLMFEGKVTALISFEAG